jgi:hypothetical protein
LEEPDDRNEEKPSDGILRFLYVHHSEDKDDLVKHQVPELIFDALLFRGSEISKHSLLDRVSQQNEQTVGEIYKRLE